MMKTQFQKILKDPKNKSKQNSNWNEAGRISVPLILTSV